MTAVLSPPVGERDHSKGPSSAPVTLVEYGDFQCPYCGAAYPVVKKLQRELGDQLRVVFRNFPIANAHRFAEWAAETAESGAAQGKFWPVHDMLFENQQLLGDEAFFMRLEARLGLDTERSSREVAARAYLPRINEDVESGLRSGVDGTPTFFIQGVRYDGPPDFESLLAALRVAIQGSRHSHQK